LQRDAEAIMEWATNYKKYKINNGCNMSIFLLGRSLGGAVTLYASTHKKF
jgi:dienelactone hydrolase